MPAQLIALAAAVSYAISGIAAKRGLRYSTPVTVTLVSVAIHAVVLWIALLIFRGVPVVSWWVLFLFVLSGLLQPILRFLTYAGIHYVGAAAGTTLRGAHPLFSTTLAILFLGESLNLLIVLGTISIVAGVALISWQGNKRQASFRWWHLAYPLSAAFLAGVSHPLRRYTLKLANEPLYLAAVIGIVALPWLVSATLLPGQNQKPVWDRRAIGPFVIAGALETLGILLGIVALSVGQVVVVSPIIATSPLWIVLGSWLFLRDIERLTLRTLLGALCVVAGTIAISIVR
ncbi:MAG TPA: DMT family transporter [Candidatus Binatia bacterium]